jgi:hypothetical protein
MNTKRRAILVSLAGLLFTLYASLTRAQSLPHESALPHQPYRLGPPSDLVRISELAATHREQLERHGYAFDGTRLLVKLRGSPEYVRPLALEGPPKAARKTAVDWTTFLQTEDHRKVIDSISEIAPEDQWRAPRSLLLDDNRISVRMADGSLWSTLHSRRSPEQAHTAIAKIAEYCAAARDTTDGHLAAVGFTPQNRTAWAGRSPTDKIVVAFSAAEAAQPGGGTRFLALLARNLAERHLALRFEPAVADLLRMPVGEAPAFADAVASVPLRDLPQKQRVAIELLAQYTSGASAIDLLVDYFGVDIFDGYMMLRNASASDALREAASRLPEEKRDAAIKRSVWRVARIYDSALFEASFSPYLFDF